MTVRPGAPIICAALLCLLSACGSAGSSTSGPHGPLYKNPVFAEDFPDPSVLRAGNTYYAYATSPSGGGAFVPELTSHDLVHWTDTGSDAMPIPPTWADTFWAPGVGRLPNGTYALYYTGHDPQLLMQCVGVAISKSARGYFKDPRTKPWLCQKSLGGTIDADVFNDGKAAYLYFKNDGNANGHPTTLWVQRLSPDGRTLVGKRVGLISNTQNWEADVIEAPDMVKHGGKYYLFFSGNHWDSPSYGVGYAICKGPMGPCTQASNNPILQYHFKGCDAEGPGGESVVTDRAGQTWMVYHAWIGSATSYTSQGTRALWLNPVLWSNGRPSVPGPTCKKEPGPTS